MAEHPPDMLIVAGQVTGSYVTRYLRRQRDSILMHRVYVMKGIMLR